MNDFIEEGSQKRFLSEPSAKFLETYAAPLKMVDFRGDPKITEKTISRTTKESPRIIGKLRFSLLDANQFDKIGPPLTFEQVKQYVRKGILDCTNGDRVQEFVDEWAVHVTNASAEKSLRSASGHQKVEGTFVALPITGHRDSKVPEIIFLETKNTLSPSEPTSTRLFVNWEGKREILKPGQTVIDLCCGSGVNGVVAGYLVGESGQVYCLDISPEAVETAQKNLVMHRSPNSHAMISDMFSNLPLEVQANAIFINPPFNTKPELVNSIDGLQGATQDFGYVVLTKLFSQVRDHLASNGKIYMLYEDIKVFDNQNAVEYLLDQHNKKGESKYILKTLIRVRRERINEKKERVLIPFVVYEIGLFS